MYVCVHRTFEEVWQGLSREPGAGQGSAAGMWVRDRGTGTRTAVVQGPRSGPVPHGFRWWRQGNLLPDWVQVVREKSWMAPRVWPEQLQPRAAFN